MFERMSSHGRELSQIQKIINLEKRMSKLNYKNFEFCIFTGVFLKIH